MNKFTKHINRRLATWFEAGLFFLHLKWEIDFAKRVPLEQDDSIHVVNQTRSFHPLDLAMFKLLFAVWAVGIIISMIAFAFEHWNNWNSNRPIKLL